MQQQPIHSQAKHSDLTKMQVTAPDGTTYDLVLPETTLEPTFTPESTWTPKPTTIPPESTDEFQKMALGMIETNLVALGVEDHTIQKLMPYIKNLRDYTQLASALNGCVQMKAAGHKIELSILGLPLNNDPKNFNYIPLQIGCSNPESANAMSSVSFISPEVVQLLELQGIQPGPVANILETMTINLSIVNERGEQTGTFLDSAQIMSVDELNNRVRGLTLNDEINFTDLIGRGEATVKKDVISIIPKYNVGGLLESSGDTPIDVTLLMIQIPKTENDPYSGMTTIGTLPLEIQRWMADRIFTETSGDITYTNSKGQPILLDSHDFTTYLVAVPGSVDYYDNEDTFGLTLFIVFISAFLGISSLAGIGYKLSAQHRREYTGKDKRTRIPQKKKPPIARPSPKPDYHTDPTAYIDNQPEAIKPAPAETLVPEPLVINHRVVINGEEIIIDTDPERSILKQLFKMLDLSGLKHHQEESDRVRERIIKSVKSIKTALENFIVRWDSFAPQTNIIEVLSIDGNKIGNLYIEYIADYASNTKGFNLTFTEQEPIKDEESTQNINPEIVEEESRKFDIHKTLSDLLPAGNVLGIQYNPETFVQNFAQIILNHIFGQPVTNAQRNLLAQVIKIIHTRKEDNSFKTEIIEYLRLKLWKLAQVNFTHENIRVEDDDTVKKTLYDNLHIAAEKLLSYIGKLSIIEICDFEGFVTPAKNFFRAHNERNLIKGSAAKEWIVSDGIRLQMIYRKDGILLIAITDNFHSRS